MSGHQRTPDVFLSMPHPCSYLPGKTAATLFIDPRFPLDRDRYGSFTRLGFRRSGDLIYRPHCPACNACLPLCVRVDDGLSAVYTFYEPSEAARGLGTFAILWEVQQARSLGLGWVYLGYWIAESRKMAYKTNFRPLEAYRNGQWTELETAAPLPPTLDPGNP